MGEYRGQWVAVLTFCSSAWHLNPREAAGWAALGRTQGFARCGQDYYLDPQHPKEKSLRVK